MEKHAVLEQAVKKLSSEDCDSVLNYIRFLNFQRENTEKTHSDKSAFFGTLKLKQDPLKMQQEMRDEWN